MRGRLEHWIRPILFLSTNPVTLIGATLTTAAAFTLIGFWALEIVMGGPTHPYAGIFLFMALPGVFVLGLLLMPAGVLWRRHRLRVAGKLPSVFPRIDLTVPVIRNGALLAAGATVVNIAIMGMATYKGVEHMDSVQFCGTTCHTVMSPEYTAYVDSPHARVACVQCHIGPGADWFVRSKLSGTRQVFAVAFGTYSRPIPSPVHELRPARETCEQCHWPRKFHGDKLAVRRRFGDDEANTRSVSVLMLRIGGEGRDGGVGIHGRHLDEAARIRYTSLDGRRVIPRVTYRDDDGKLVEFVSHEKEYTAEELAGAEQREMDCVDCHNRPTHEFEMPAPAVDEALAAGEISASLPFIKKTAVELLEREYPDRDTARNEIVRGVESFYEREYPEVWTQRRAEVGAAADRIGRIYLRNIFPAMNVTWGTHPNHIGHTSFPGCFRCHDDEHVSDDGRTITQDCEACHALLAMEEEDPQILSDLGIE